MRDVVVGAITNYGFEDIRAWVNSLDRSGFDGVKAVICFNVAFETIEELEKRGYVIFTFARNERSRRAEYHGEFSIVVDRFLHLWKFLGEHFNAGDVRYVVATDVKDVIFQRNPSVWLQAEFAPSGKQVLVGSESLRYEDEPWGANNLRLAFGDALFEYHRKNLIYNAGTLAGSYATMLDLFLNVYLMSKGAPQRVPGGGGPDQAALNILLQSAPYRAVTKFATSEEGWCAQLGTTVDPAKIDGLRAKLVEPAPQFVDGTVVTSTGRPFALVHQYDRVPAWRDVIEARFLDDAKVRRQAAPPPRSRLQRLLAWRS